MITWVIQHWSDLELNLFAEAVGVIVELFLTYILINFILSRRDAKNRFPARRAIASHIAKTYGALFNASNHIIRRIFESSHGPADQASILFLNQVHARLQRLQRIVDSAGISLSPKGMSDATVFLEMSETILRKLRFYSGIHNPAMQMDLVGPTPYAEFRAIETIANSFKKDFPEVFSASEIGFSGLLTSDELQMVWENAKCQTDRLCFEPSQYVHKQGRTPSVYDSETLRGLSIPSNDHSRVHLFYGL